MTWIHVISLLAFVALLAFFFAKVEIHIEGKDGWAGSLPTWRIEEHWLLDIFWGGRPMTGYHAWAFSFMALAFHLPLLFFLDRVLISLGGAMRYEARAVGCVVIFWVVEDFLWFVFNPHFGFRRFSGKDAHWHKHWILGVPVDYVLFSVVGAGLMWYSFS